jgi:hypothetical protein
MCVRAVSMLKRYPLKIIYFAMFSKLTYFSLLKHPRHDIHELVKVDRAGKLIFVYELTPPNGILLLQRICNAGITL